MEDNIEISKLTIVQQQAVREATGLARKTPGQHMVKANDDSGEAYAYQSGDEIHWGFNTAPNYACAARGVQPL
jgi:hypothetical protein